MKVHLCQPFSREKNLGKAYNEAFANCPDGDWLCLMDYDAMLLTPDAVNIIYNYVLSYPDTGIFTCFTNRIHPLAVDQLLNGKLSEDYNIKNHVQIALNQRQFGAKITPLNHVISGFLMVVCKKTWLEIPFNEDLLCLGVDNDFSQKVLDSGRKILRMDSLYVWHTYRIMNGISDKSHLK